MKKLFISQPMRDRSGSWENPLSCFLRLILHTSPKAGKMQEAVELKISALSSTALRLSRITQRSREEVILLSPSHG